MNYTQPKPKPKQKQKQTYQQTLVQNEQQQKTCIDVLNLMTLKGIMLSERGQPRKLTFCMIPFECQSHKDKTIVTDQWLPGIRVMRRV